METQTTNMDIEATNGTNQTAVVPTVASLKQLIAQKDAIEKEIKELTEFLNTEGTVAAH
jgi:hypothetical protein